MCVHALTSLVQYKVFIDSEGALYWTVRVYFLFNFVLIWRDTVWGFTCKTIRVITALLSPRFVLVYIPHTHRHTFFIYFFYHNAYPVCSWGRIQLHNCRHTQVCLHLLRCRKVCCHSHGAHRGEWCKDGNLKRQSLGHKQATIHTMPLICILHKELTNVGVIKASRDQSLRGPEVPGSRRVATIASVIKKKNKSLVHHNSLAIFCSAIV